MGLCKWQSAWTEEENPLALREEFERSGNQMFRQRSYLPLVFIGIYCYALRGYTYPGNSARLDTLLEIFCLLVSFFGLAIRIFTIGHTPERTSGRNTQEQIADTLNTTGLYSVVRHPLYVGNFVIWLGIILFAHLWWLVLIYVLAFWLYYERIMFAEEEFLRKKFSDEFTRWGATTPAFIPRFRGYVKPHLPFSTKTALKREYNGAFAIILVLFILEVASDAIVEHRFECDLFWKIILGVGFGMWMVLRTLKKKTTLLRVQGR